MVDLSTHYLGLPLKNPLVASASPLSRHLDTALRLEEAGIAAIVMHSLFEEQIIRESHALDYYLSHGAESYAESLSYLPDVGPYSVGPETYLERVRRLKERLGIPIIGSLNGVSSGGWVEYAHLIQEAAELEDTYVELIGDIRKVVHIPLAVKLSPYFTALPHMVSRLTEAGANGFVLFNRFYQPDIDLEELEIVPNLQFSHPDELRLPLRWIALLAGRVHADFAATSGIHHATDVLKVVMVGANVAMMASALLQHGPEHATTTLNDIQAWMAEHEYESITQMHGSMRQAAVAEPAAFERANYMKVLGSYDHDPRFAPSRARLRRTAR
jgi:dihydroorotate dehydrogenase (fumarate)